MERRPITSYVRRMWCKIDEHQSGRQPRLIFKKPRKLGCVVVSGLLRVILVLLVVVGVSTANTTRSMAAPCDHSAAFHVLKGAAGAEGASMHRPNAEDPCKGVSHGHSGGACNNTFCCAAVMPPLLASAPILIERLAAALDRAVPLSDRIMGRAVAPPHGPPRLTV